MTNVKEYMENELATVLDNISVEIERIVKNTNVFIVSVMDVMSSKEFYNSIMSIISNTVKDSELYYKGYEEKVYDMIEESIIDMVCEALA